ncbi:MAG: peptidoglycan editing factor PgeF [Nitrospira sp.]|nr:peptidoglycan editing factor PgeF [Nitrospira sp.]
MQQSYILRKTDHTRYLVIPEFEMAGATHFFGLKASFKKSHIGQAHFNGSRVLTAKQVHQDRVLVLESQIQSQKKRATGFGRASAGGGSNGPPQIADAIVTRGERFFVGVYTADCLPILLMDPQKKTVAAVHAGWRGSLLHVAAKAAQEMILKMGCRPEHLLAALGPSIGSCCYEVGELVLEPLKSLYSHGTDVVRLKKDGKGMLNLLELNRRQLLEIGLQDENLYAVGLCTYCHADLFSSYRREGKGTTGMLSGIMYAR